MDTCNHVNLIDKSAENKGEKDEPTERKNAEIDKKENKTREHA